MIQVEPRSMKVNVFILENSRRILILELLSPKGTKLLPEATLRFLIMLLLSQL